MLALLPGPAQAEIFRIGEVQGLVNLEVSYGLLARVQSRDERLVAIVNGGTSASANADDGDLNYDEGVVSNLIRGTADLTLTWRQFGIYVRGYGYYDFENELGERARTPLSGEAEDFVGARVGLLEHYLSARFTLAGMPVMLRLGDQVVNWGESTFLRNGIDVVNPIDLVQLFQPGTLARDVFRPQGMLWGVVNLSEIFSFEAFYQYDWKDVRVPPVGTYFSSNDAIGTDGLNTITLGAGRVSDQGTDLDAAFGLPPGTLGFDRDFLLMPGLDRDKPSNGGQYGFTLLAIVPQWNATKLSLHFTNYHSRLALLDGVTADAATILRTTEPAVAARTLELEAEGLAPPEAREAAELLTISDYANNAGYVATYPEDIKMLGASFATTTLRTGTLISGEVSHHFDWPFQILVGEVVDATLSPIRFLQPPGSGAGLGPNQRVPGFIRRDRTQLELGLTQLFGPQLGSSQSLLGVDFAWVHVHDMPGRSEQPLNAPGLVPPFDEDRLPSADSWGYRIAAQLTYTNVLGGANLSPFALWTHDVGGTTPGPAGAFIEGRKTFTIGVALEYVKTWTARLGYTSFFGAGRFNPVRDRDFISFSVGASL